MVMEQSRREGFFMSSGGKPARHWRVGLGLTWLVSLWLMLMSLFVSADTGQLYLVARQAPEASITGTQSSEQVVYLRWDTVEGRLPEEVTRLRLYRGDQSEPLLDVAAHQIMSANMIAGLYQGAAQQRRRLETFTGLQELVAGGSGQALSGGQLGEAIYQQLTTDDFWGFLASRSDFNIARARFRGWVDRPGSGVHEYELKAYGADGQSARLGRVIVDTGAPQALLPAVNFRQVSQASCDLPEFARDHHTVSLAWDAPGTGNPTDVYAAQLFVAGFDIYRTRENMPHSMGNVPPARDIAALAAQGGMDARGQPVFDGVEYGLEKVNDVLLTLSPDGTDQPEWIETWDELSRAGLRPGDRRGYYLVPRDFTGNYGPTTALMVTVPDQLRPPTPWDIRVFNDEQRGADAPASTVISFDRVDLDNFIARYRTTRRFCNLDEARSTGIIHYVGVDQRCAVDTHRKVNLNVAEYRIYRFDSFDQASGFQDSDGDGVPDQIERDYDRVNQPAQPTLCDAERQPPGAQTYRVDSVDRAPEPVTLPRSQLVRKQFRDTVSAENRGRVYWYRIAALTGDGMVSLLTAPVRAVFPDRALPEPPDVDTTRNARELCDCALEERPSSRWSFTDRVGTARSVYLECSNWGTPYQIQGDDVCAAPGGGAELAKYCPDGPVALHYPFPPVEGQLSCSAPVPAGTTWCGAHDFTLVPTYCDTEQPVSGGEVITGPLIIRGSTAATEDQCMSVYKSTSGGSQRLGTSCGTDTPTTIEVTVDSGLFCGYVVSHDSNNNVSVPRQIPCVLVRPEQLKAPAPPQLVAFDAGETEAEFSWRLPIDPVAVLMARLEHRTADGQERIDYLPVPVSGRGSADVEVFRTAIPELAGDQDELCLSLRALGPDHREGQVLMSAWSSPRCIQRERNPVAAPVYLPWPVIARVQQGAGLTVAQIGEYARQDYPSFEVVTHFLDLGPVTDISAQGEAESGCFYWDQYNPPGDDSSPVLPVRRLFPQLICDGAGKTQVEGILAGYRAVMVYRQARTPDGNLSDWVQVTPLLDYVHWEQYLSPDNRSGRMHSVHYLNDPYVYLYARDEDDWRLALVDRHPIRAGNEYRYQMVFFDPSHRIAQWRESPWMTSQPVTAFSANAGGDPDPAP